MKATHEIIEDADRDRILQHHRRDWMCILHAMKCLDCLLNLLGGILPHVRLFRSHRGGE